MAFTKSSEGGEEVMEVGKLLKLNEVAGILRVSRATVVRLIKAGRLKAVKVGRQWRIPEEALKAIISGKKKEGE